MDIYGGIEINLEEKQYRIELINESNYGIRMNLRRDIGHKTKDHGSIFLQKEDIDSLIEALNHMKENINWIE